MENDRNLLLRVWLMPQCRPFPRLACDPLHALIEGRIADLSALVAHLCRNRNGMDHTVKLRHGDAHRDLHRIEPRRRFLPLLLRSEHRVRLKHGYTERIEILDARAARLDGELHRTDDDIDKGLPVPAKIFLNRIHQRRRLHALVAVGIREHGDRIHPLRLDCADECRMIGKVSRNPFRAVEDHADGRSSILVMSSEIARNVLGIPRPVRMIDTVPRERTRRLCCAGKSPELPAEPVEEIAHILLAVVTEICPCGLDLLLRKAIRHLVVLGIVHNDQMRNPMLL